MNGLLKGSYWLFKKFLVNRVEVATTDVVMYERILQTCRKNLWWRLIRRMHGIRFIFWVTLDNLLNRGDYEAD